ncbi:MAG: helix-turn-helix transcriptional regulator [Desulfobacterales bacterium]|nr:helix-turn-helix transcriptional regulator [Desulfobacterales bacterium]
MSLNNDVRKLKDAFPPPWSHPIGRAPHYLTNSEIRVLSMVAFGKTNKEIADALFIEPSTVRTHVKRIHAKSDPKGRSRLAISAYKVWAEGNSRESRILRTGEIKDECSRIENAER